MKLKEMPGSIFDTPRECYVECASSDFRRSNGIGQEFDKRFNVRGKLIDKWGANYNKYFNRDGGGAVVTTNPLVISLITKKYYYDKPTYPALDIALGQCADLCYGFEIFEISMPRIGCGNGGLDWGTVKGIIESKFKDLNVLISIYDC